MKFLIKAKAICGYITGALAGLAGFLLILIMLGTDVGVVTRYGFNNPIPLLMDISDYSIFFLTFLGTAWVLKQGGHVRVDIVLNLVNPKRRLILNIATSVLGVLVCLALVWYGTDTALYSVRNAIMETRSVNIPKWTLIAVIPFGFLLLAIQSLTDTIAHIKERRDLPGK